MNNTKKILYMSPFAAVSMITAILAAGCDLSGHYHPETQNLDVTKYFGVALDGFGKTTVYAASAHSVTVTADMDIVERITVDVDSIGVLRVGAKRDAGIDDGGVSAFKRWPIGVEARLNHLQYVAIGKNGVGDITVAAADGTAPEMLVFHEGEGDIDLRRYNVSAVTVVHSGKGRVRVGEVDTIYIDSTAFHSSFATIHYAGKRPEIMWFRKWDPTGWDCVDNDPDKSCPPNNANLSGNRALSSSIGRPPIPTTDGGHPPPPNTEIGEGWIDAETINSSMNNKIVADVAVVAEVTDGQ